MLKNDKGKLRMDLIPFDALDIVAEVLTFGEHKYTDNGWRAAEVDDLPRFEAALLRHLSKHMQGAFIDADSGLEHMAHVATNAMFILAIRKKGDKDGD